MLLGGDFIGVLRAADGSLSLLIGDVTGHGPSAAGTGAMLRAAWLGAVQADVELESIPKMLDRLPARAGRSRSGRLATVCLVEVDRDGRHAKVVRAGHDSPLLITPGAVARWTAFTVRRSAWAVSALAGAALPDCPPKRRSCCSPTGSPNAGPSTPAELGFDDLLPRIDRRRCSTGRPSRRSTRCSRELFPEGHRQPSRTTSR